MLGVLPLPLLATARRTIVALPLLVRAATRLRTPLAHMVVVAPAIMEFIIGRKAMPLHERPQPPIYIHTRLPAGPRLLQIAQRFIMIPRILRVGAVATLTVMALLVIPAL